MSEPLSDLAEYAKGLPPNTRAVRKVHAERFYMVMRNEPVPPLAEMLVGRVQGVYLDRNGCIREIPRSRFGRVLMRLRAERIYW